MMVARITLFFLMVFQLAGCKNGKEPIRYGTDACNFCKMITMDRRFGAEIITVKGKIFKFDDVNCMVSFLNGQGMNGVDASSLYVIDYSAPGVLIEATSAFYVHSDRIKSPMASGVAAFSSTDARYEQQQKWQGTELGWEEIISRFK